MPTESSISADYLIAHLAGRLRAWRALHNWTQDDLATRARVSHNTVAAIEAGRTNPRLSTLLKIADALNITVVELLRDDR